MLSEAPRGPSDPLHLQNALLDHVFRDPAGETDILVGGSSLDIALGMKSKDSLSKKPKKESFDTAQYPTPRSSNMPKGRY